MYIEKKSHFFSQIQLFGRVGTDGSLEAQSHSWKLFQGRNRHIRVQGFVLFFTPGEGQNFVSRYRKLKYLQKWGDWRMAGLQTQGYLGKS